MHRRYTPYFFSKKELDSVLQASLDNYFKSLALARRRQRHARAGAGGGAQASFPGAGGALPGDKRPGEEGDEEDAFGSLPDPSELRDGTWYSMTSPFTYDNTVLFDRAYLIQYHV